MRKIIYTALILFTLFPAVAGANFIQDIFSWYGSSADKSVGDLRVLTVPQGGTGAATLTGCLEGNGTGAVTGTGSACASGGGSDPFTHPATGIFATTTNFIIGSDTTASSTLIGGLNITGNSTTTNATTTNLFSTVASSSAYFGNWQGDIIDPAYGGLGANFGTAGNGVMHWSDSLDQALILSSFTTLGSVLTGELAVADGGTGAGTLTGLLVGNGTSAFTAISGTTCTNQFLRAFTSSGGTCATVTSSDVSLADLTATDTTLTFSGTYNGSTARTIGLNLGNANTWTALQNFSANASTTQLTVTGNTYLATTGGNVGIGTSAPGAKLDVVGADTADKLNLSTYTTGATGSNIRIKHARGTAGTPTTLSNGDDFGQFIFQGYDGTSFLNGAQIKASVEGAVSTGVMPGNLTFLTDQGFERMRIASGGNVGIGDTSPSALFVVGSGDLFRVGSDGSATSTNLHTSAKALSIESPGQYVTATTTGTVSHIASTTISSITNKSFDTGTTTFRISFPESRKLNSLGCQVPSGTVNFEVGDFTSSSTVVCTSTWTETYLTSNNTFTAREAIYYSLKTLTGTPGGVNDINFTWFKTSP